MDFSLSPKNLKEVPFQKYAGIFTFIVNGKRYQTNRFVADILSPFIRKAHFADETIDEFYINTNNSLEKETSIFGDQSEKDDIFVRCYFA